MILVVSFIFMLEFYSAIKEEQTTGTGNDMDEYQTLYAQ